MPKKINLLVTAGPTREMLDPVRFLSNVSTGNMGYETAKQGARMGFRVTLISGPTALGRPKNVRFIPVVSAAQMKEAILREWKKTDILIMTAAVCDYTPVRFSPSKIKRIKQRTIRFKRTEDILELVGKKKAGRILVGFALETENWEQNAVRKLRKKNLDYIVANWYGRGNYPFGTGRTSMVLMDRSGAKKLLSHVTKVNASKFILSELRRRWNTKNS